MLSSVSSSLGRTALACLCALQSLSACAFGLLSTRPAMGRPSPSGWTVVCACCWCCAIPFRYAPLSCDRAVLFPSACARGCCAIPIRQPHLACCRLGRPWADQAPLAGLSLVLVVGAVRFLSAKHHLHGCPDSPSRTLATRSVLTLSGGRCGGSTLSRRSNSSCTLVSFSHRLCPAIWPKSERSV